MALAFDRNESHPLIDALLRTRISRWQELNRAIDERDDMLHFDIGFFDHDRDRALEIYFRNGLEQFRVVRQIASWRGPVRRMLDFASGYGRLTRFLLHEGLVEDLTVSDILEGGMAFQAEQFGVRTILSTVAPEEFRAPFRFDLIFVASLFTHLPPAAFTPWLRRLIELLEPEGLLIFSVHDESLTPGKIEGIHFVEHSPSRTLDAKEYGSTWVNESYVRDCVASIDPALTCLRLPRELLEWQDVYVVSPSPLPRADTSRSATGWLDRFAISGDGIYVGGWATAVDEKADRIEVRIDDDIVVTTRHFAPRPDVAAVFGVESSTECAWALVIPHAAVKSFLYQVVTISAFTRGNKERILYLGTIDSLRGQIARNSLSFIEERLAIVRQQRWECEQQIAVMKKSRFWKARERWFRFKRSIGRTD